MRIGPKASIAHGVVIHGPCVIGEESFVALRTVIYSATIKGDDITISSKAQYESDAVLDKEFLDGFKFSDLFKAGSVLLFDQNIFSVPLGALGRIADASVKISGSTLIEADTNVAIQTTAGANGSVSVVNPDFSIGFGLAHANRPREQLPRCPLVDLAGRANPVARW